MNLLKRFNYKKCKLLNSLFSILNTLIIYRYLNAASHHQTHLYYNKDSYQAVAPRVVITAKITKQKLDFQYTAFIIVTTESISKIWRHSSIGSMFTTSNQISELITLDRQIDELIYVRKNTWLLKYKHP